MGRLWWRRLRIPIYCIVILMVMRLFWNSLFSESKLMNKYGVEDGRGVRKHPSVISDEGFQSDSIRSENLDINEKVELRNDYKAYETEALEYAIPQKYQSIKRKMIVKSTKQLKTSTEELDSMLHDIQLKPPNFNGAVKNMKMDDQIEDVEVLEDNSKEQDPVIAFQSEGKNEILNPNKHSEFNKFDESEQPVATKESIKVEKNAKTANKNEKNSEQANFRRKPGYMEDSFLDRPHFEKPFNDEKFDKQPVKSLMSNQIEENVNAEESELPAADDQPKSLLGHEKSVQTEKQYESIQKGSIQPDKSTNIQKLKHINQYKKSSKLEGKLSLQQMDQLNMSLQPVRGLDPIQSEKLVDTENLERSNPYEKSSKVEKQLNNHQQTDSHKMSEQRVKVLHPIESKKLADAENLERFNPYEKSSKLKEQNQQSDNHKMSEQPVKLLHPIQSEKLVDTENLEQSNPYEKSSKLKEQNQQSDNHKMSEQPVKLLHPIQSEKLVDTENLEQSNPYEKSSKLKEQNQQSDNHKMSEQPVKLLHPIQSEKLVDTENLEQFNPYEKSSKLKEQNQQSDNHKMSEQPVKLLHPIQSEKLVDTENLEQSNLYEKSSKLKEQNQQSDNHKMSEQPVKLLHPIQSEKLVDTENLEQSNPYEKSSKLKEQNQQSDNHKMSEQPVKLLHPIQSEKLVDTENLERSNPYEKSSKLKEQVNHQQTDKHEMSEQPVKFLHPIQSQKLATPEKFEKSSNNISEQPVKGSHPIQNKNNLDIEHGEKPINSKQFVQTDKLIEPGQSAIQDKANESEKLGNVEPIHNSNAFVEFFPTEKLVFTETSAHVQELNKTLQHDEIKADQLKNFNQKYYLSNRDSSLIQPIIYKPDWDSLDSRPLPLWYDHAKFGIFIHWGVFSVPSFSSEKFWWKWKGSEKDETVVQFMKKNYPKNFTYTDFAKNFTAEFFNATEWARLFQESGAQYVVLTSKHHEGYTLWPSHTSKNWNSGEVGPHKDLVRLLANAVRSTTSLKFGLYYSLFEWFHKLYLKDKEQNFQSTRFVDEKVLPDLQSLINNYAPDILWADGDFGPASYWKSKEFLTWLYNESKVKDTVVTNDRWGEETHCKHGDFTLCPAGFQPKKRKWEMGVPIDKLSWGYRRTAELKELMTTREILTLLVTTVSKGGNLLLNIGPTKEGVIPPIFQERLMEIGSWLKVNGEAIYSSVPWRAQEDSLADGVRYTYKEEAIYAFITTPPKTSTIILGSPVGSKQSKVYVLGWNDVGIPWNYDSRHRDDRIKVKIPKECWLSGASKSIVTLKLVNFK